MFVKVCGLRTSGDVAAAVAAGVDAIGFVLTESVRCLEVDEARQLVAEVPSGVLTVGVFRGIPTAEVGRLAAETGVEAVQLHGSYPPDAFKQLDNHRLIRATTLTAETDLRVGVYGEDMLLLDSPIAGSGQRWDLSALTQPPHGHWLLAGGLTPDNVAMAISAVRPWGVDVSSGVESTRGVKDQDLIRQFVAAARAGASVS
jgi:phosphoribosylanthranilate isomerase